MLKEPVGSLLAGLAKSLAQVTETPGLDASVLLAAVLARPRAWVLAHPEARLSADQQDTLETGVRRLLAGEPLPYVLGNWAFYGLAFAVSPSALIPRPETELIVAEALKWLGAHPQSRHMLDAGTGTGCIAISLAVHCPDLVCTAVDISRAALELARQNVLRHQVAERVHLVEGDLASSFGPAAFDLVCANLPYIPSEDLQSLRVARFEPHLALDGGEDGMALIRVLLRQAGRVLKPGGVALLEIEERQGNRVRELAAETMPAAQVSVLPDLAGKDRLVRVELPPGISS